MRAVLSDSARHACLCSADAWVGRLTPVEEGVASAAVRQAFAACVAEGVSPQRRSLRAEDMDTPDLDKRLEGEQQAGVEVAVEAGRVELAPVEAEVGEVIGPDYHASSSSAG